MINIIKKKYLKIIFPFGNGRKKINRKKIRKKSSLSASHQHYLENKETARRLIMERVEYYNQFYKFSYNKIRIKNQKTRWGSCSSKDNLNFNYKIIFLEKKLQDYIIIHELCHLREMNHSENFWKLVAETMPDYREIRKRLTSALDKL